MTTEELREMYRSFLEQAITVRRYTGSGVGRPRFDAAVAGHARTYGERELVGGIQQGDQKVIVLADDLIAQQMAMPVLNSDKVVVGGRELAIMAVLPRKASDGTVVAYELQARG